LTAKTPLERVQESEKFLERLMLMVPGFRGYQVREQRREADRVVRSYIYDALEHSRDDLMRCFQVLSDNKISELTEPINRTVAKVDRVAEKVNHASYGYSGFFDAIKIEQPELDNMLAYDTQLMDSARKFAEAATALRIYLEQSKVEDARNMQQALDTSLGSLESAFDQRKSIIEAVKV